MTAWSGPVIAVKRAILNGFGDVGSADGVGGVEVGDRERYFQDAVVGAGQMSDRVKSFSTEACAGGRLSKANPLLKSKNHRQGLEVPAQGIKR